MKEKSRKLKMKLAASNGDLLKNTLVKKWASSKSFKKTNFSVQRKLSLFLLSVKVEFLECLEERNFLRPPWKDEVSWEALLMM